MSDTTAQPPADQFPQEPSAFVGRRTELARLSEILAASRLITVTGPGGVGKTRLAMRAAADAEAAFPDGVYLVELSALRDPELLANAVSAGLGLSEHDSRGQLEQVLDYLHERRLLLVLDTCEHLVEACALFAEAMLAGTRHVTILATSRQPLLADGEHECPLSPLGAGGDAVDLFAQRAAAAAPGFAVTDANREDVARLCAQLDGIPLAIELAAGRLREESLGELARRLDDHFLDAAGTQDSAAGRHRTLRDAIGWSYELCTPAERVLWERLAVFAGPVGADAAKQVCAGPGLSGEATMSTVFGLVDKSVLSRSDGSGGASRYGMLDTIREYGAERLAASGTQPRIRARHLRRYLAMAEDLAANPLENQVPKFAALRAEHADIRAALEYAATVETGAGAGHPALRLPADLEWYWMISARCQEARYWLTSGLERIPEPGPDRVRALLARGLLTMQQGDAQSALADAEAGLALADGIGDRPLRARALTKRGWALLCVGRLEEAKQAMKEAGTLTGLDARDGTRAILDVGKAYIYLLTSDPHGALRHCERSLRRMPADSGERWANGYLYIVVSLALTMLGEPDKGNQAARHAVAMKHELRDTAGIANCLGVVALVASAQRRPERTAWMLGATDVLCEQFGTPWMGVEAMKALADQAAQEARAALGGDRYDQVIRDVRSRSINEIVDMTVSDRDRIPALSPARR